MMLIISLLLISGIAYADDLPPECKLLPTHTPQSDVSAEYKAGIDVHGKPVVPADINAQPFPSLERVVIPLSVDLAERINVSVPGLDLDADLGTLEIYQSGRVVHNGQDWTSQVYILCGKEGLQNTQVPPDGQTAQEPLESRAIEVEPLKAVPPSDEVIEGGASRDERIKN